MKARSTIDYDTLDFPFEVKSLDDAGALEGYAAVFGNLDQGGDIIEAGAFTKTIKETGGQVPILYQHDRYEPIGVSADLSQDRYGLLVKGQLNMDVQRARETRSLLNQGAMQGLSIGYKTIKKAYAGSARKLQELALREFSPVTFPMNELAVATVKAAGDLVWDPDFTLDALRRQLREALNPPGSFTYWIRDIATDGASALVSSYDDDCEAYVVAFSFDADGNLEVAPFSDWVPAEQVWVQADDSDKSVAAAAFTRTRALLLDMPPTNVVNGPSRAALADTQKQISALLDGTEPADATPDDDGAAKNAETPAFDLATLGAFRPSHTSQENDRS